jgi:hypothetical protein
MAVQPPPAPTTVPVGPPPAAPQGSGCRRGCGFGCGGCLLAFVLAVLLVVAGGYYLFNSFVRQAQADVPSPAALLLITPPVDVGTNDSGYKSATPGQALTAGNSVRTGHGGHAAIQFPDGSYLRMSPDTTVTVDSARLGKNGNLQSASLVQKVGRTLTSVQHLVSGANFKVAGHSVSAQVRGTQFEILVRPNGTNLIKVFEGSVTVTGKTTVTLNAGQQLDVDASGNLSNPKSIQSEPQDPYPQAALCSKTASSGTTAGTAQTSSGDSLTTGQTAEHDYNSPGGNLTLVFCYPGSLMGVTVTDPNGAQYSAQGPPPLTIKIPNGAPGLYRAIVHALNVPSGGEAYSMTFATDAPCASGNIDTGTVVRHTLTNAELLQAIQQSGATGVSLQVEGTSNTSARISYSGDLGGVPLAWTFVFYAATPNLGTVLTHFSVRGVDLTTQFASRITSATGESVTSVPSDFTVDRVYSCTGPEGGMMVIEGHR